jgi:hypothetical protein
MRNPVHPQDQAEHSIMRVSFTEHPHDVGESYGEHFRVALHFSGAMLRGGLACLVHAFLPFCCTTTGSQTIKRLHEEMIASRRRKAAELTNEVAG